MAGSSHQRGRLPGLSRWERGRRAAGQFHLLDRDHSIGGWKECGILLTSVWTQWNGEHVHYENILLRTIENKMSRKFSGTFLLPVNSRFDYAQLSMESYASSNCSLTFLVCLPRSSVLRIRLRMRYDSGVTSSSSSSDRYSMASSRDMRRGGVRRISISPPAERIFVRCFFLQTL